MFILCEERNEREIERKGCVAEEVQQKKRGEEKKISPSHPCIKKLMVKCMCVWASHPFFENLGVGITKISMGFLHGTFFFGAVTSVFSRIRGFWLTGGHRAKKCIFFFLAVDHATGEYITHSPKLRIIFQIFHSLDPDAYFLSSDPGIERFETALSKEIKISKK